MALLKSLGPLTFKNKSLPLKYLDIDFAAFNRDLIHTQSRPCRQIFSSGLLDHCRGHLFPMIVNGICLTVSQLGFLNLIHLLFLLITLCTLCPDIHVFPCSVSLLFVFQALCLCPGYPGLGLPFLCSPYSNHLSRLSCKLAFFHGNLESVSAH